MTVQRIRKEYKDDIEIAIKYYSILFILNNIHITQREIELVAYTAIRGNITAGGRKEEFIKMFNSSKATIGNMKHRLQKLGIFEKENDRMRVNSKICPDFTAGVQLNIICGKAG